MHKLDTIITKLEEEIYNLSADETSVEDAAPQVTRDPEASEKSIDDNNHLNSQDPLELSSENRQDFEDGDDLCHTVSSADTETTSDPRNSSSDRNDVEETGIEIVVKSQGSDNENCGSPQSQTDFLEETNEGDKDKEETDKEWITVG